MKATIAIFGLTALAASAAPGDYVNFVRQIQEDTGVEWDVSVAPFGAMLSPEGVGEAGALFELWSVHSLTAFDYLLDEEFVSAYTPEVTITVQTLDPYEVIPRTRVDQPFTVTMQVGGLLSALDAPAEAKRVVATHEAFAYPDGLHGFPVKAERTGTMVSAGYLNGNGAHPTSYPMTSIPGADLTKVEGEEEFKAYSATDTGLAGEILDSALVQVWPIAAGVISGVTAGQKYDVLPLVQIFLTDLYPDSETYLRVYKGSPGDLGDPTNVQSSYVIIRDVVPQDRVVTLDDLDALFPKSGKYTFEVLHETPFGTDLLDQIYPVILDRTIEVRGTLYAKE